MAFMSASGVRLIDQLRDPLTGINKQRQESLKGSLGRIGSRQTASSRASGRVLGEYAPAELSRAGGMASRSLEDTLLGALGGASFDETRKQQEHQASMALAREIGALSAPSLLQQVLGGLSGGARTGMQFGQLYGALNKPSSPKGRIPQDFYFTDDEFGGSL